MTSWGLLSSAQGVVGSRGQSVPQTVSLGESETLRILSSHSPMLQVGKLRPREGIELSQGVPDFPRETSRLLKRTSWYSRTD